MAVLISGSCPMKKVGYGYHLMELASNFIRYWLYSQHKPPVNIAVVHFAGKPLFDRRVASLVDIYCPPSIAFIVLFNMINTSQ